MHFTRIRTQADRDAYNKQTRERRERNKDAYNAAQRERYWKNRDAVLARQLTDRQTKPEKFAAQRRKQNKKRRAFLDAIRLYYGCCNPGCLWDGPLTSPMLEFHHVDEATKEFCVSRNSRSLALVCKEINKCCVLCANCHREASYGQLDCSSFQKCHVTVDGKLVGLV